VTGRLVWGAVSVISTVRTPLRTLGNMEEECESETLTPRWYRCVGDTISAGGGTGE
jgi:hypothetical protein